MPEFLIGDNNDWGFGLWPPDPWETLIQDPSVPLLSESALTVDGSWNGGGNAMSPRTFESAEREGEGGVNQGLVHRLQLAFPVCRDKQR